MDEVRFLPITDNFTQMRILIFLWSHHLNMYHIMELSLLVLVVAVAVLIELVLEGNAHVGQSPHWTTASLDPQLSCWQMIQPILAYVWVTLSQQYLLIDQSEQLSYWSVWAIIFRGFYHDNLLVSFILSCCRSCVPFFNFS